MDRNLVAGVGLVALLLLGVAVWSTLPERPNAGVYTSQNNARGKVKQKRRGKLKGQRGKRKGKGKSKGKVLRHDPLAVDRPVAREGAPNVVMLIGCTLRRDQISPYGASERVTPYLSGFAASGARFADTITAAPWTRPATVALLSGQHALSIGMIEPKPRRSDRALARSVTTLAERFRDAGYITVGATANPNLNAVFGFAQGFDAYYEASGLWRNRTGKVGGGVLVPKTLSILDDTRQEGRPVYLQLMLIDAHAPANVKPEVAAPFAIEGEPLQMAKYRAMVNRFDRFAKLLDQGLAKRGLRADNTLFVVVGDHGEGVEWPQPNGKGHGKYLFPAVTQVPWLIRGPGVAEGAVIEGLASGVDVAPTLLALAGLEGYQGPGQSWAAQVRGELPSTTRQRAWVDTWYQVVNRAGVYTPTKACQQDFGGGKASKGEGPRFVDGCFDRQADPHWAGEPTQDRVLLDALDAWRAEEFASYNAFTDLRDGPVSGNISAQLEALGYVQ